MDDFKRVQVYCCLDDLANDEGSNVLRKVLFFSNKLIQVFALDVLSDDVDMCLASDGLLVAHYFRMRDDLHDLALVVQHGNCLTGQLVSANVLQCIGFSCLFISAAIHD